LEELGVDGRIILKYSKSVIEGVGRAELMWLKIGAVGMRL